MSKFIATVLSSLLLAGAAYAQASRPMAAPGTAGIPGAPAAQVGAATSAATAPPPMAAPMAAPAPAMAAPAAAAPVAATAAAAGGGPDKVWVNTKSNIYHCPGTKYYGKTRAGEYMSEADAKAKGARSGQGKPCSAS
jgi:hypothetical protein